MIKFRVRKVFELVSKMFAYLVCVLLLWNCNRRNASDCFSKCRRPISRETGSNVARFYEKITAYMKCATRPLNKEKAYSKVKWETGGNIWRNGVYGDSGGWPICCLRDTNDCNFYTKNTGLTKVYHYTPQTLTEIQKQLQLGCRT